MKLNHDLVRLLLLDIENSDSPYGFSTSEINNFREKHGFSKNEIGYTVAKLNEAGFITGNNHQADNDPFFIIMPGNLTYAGHEYLDNIRDNKIWRETKKQVSNVSSVSLNIISQVAAALISKAVGID
ncbi:MULTISPECIES: DUF2513 domain-containing protein [Leuconostoc]|uniref:DUF2513 domain-containing protein n=1 Tax=Leuconostoc TaxID=1243 RepID=UPI00090C0325|nr:MULTISPECIES: DUF2513 domain-containing protein [Leuconostoc]API72632.1 hypothetical protein A6B45_08045 [Leuconostoc suionicum]MBZ1502924.1 DUF2513 domain-containing protein [Leuconostoc mesenteroides]TDV87774.1 uncharacterized protein DUF2513 [Leuconostoc mesenteroides]BAX71303.1 hypothetical protein LEUCM_01865 [Leuconostoc suionicum]